MTVGDTFANLFLKHLLQNAPLPGIGDVSGLLASAVAGNLFVSLHTAPVLPGDLQTAHEAAYVGYAGVNRVGIARSSGGWTVTLRNGINAVTYQPPAATGNHQTITDLAIGTLISGAGMVLFGMTLETAFITNTGTLPAFPPGAISISL